MRDAVHLGRVGVDLDDGELVVDAPVDARPLQPRADREHHVHLRPHRVRAGDHMGERMAVVHHALAAPIGRDRRAEPLGQRLHLRPRIERAAAEEDQRRSAFSSSFAARSIASSSSCCASGGSGAAGSMSARACRMSGAISRPTGCEPARGHVLERLRHEAGRILRPLDPRRPFGQRLQDAELVRESRAAGRGPCR